MARRVRAIHDSLLDFLQHKSNKKHIYKAKENQRNKALPSLTKTMSAATMPGNSNMPGRVRHTGGDDIKSCYLSVFEEKTV